MHTCTAAAKVARVEIPHCPRRPWKSSRSGSWNWRRNLPDHFSNSAGTPLGRDAVAKLLKKHTAEAITACPSQATKNVTTYTLRHTTATLLLQAGVGLSVVAIWLGHQSIETTQIYLHADMRLKERPSNVWPRPRAPGTGVTECPLHCSNSSAGANHQGLCRPPGSENH
ncbi:tyrosine-type recombinase/integrase [Arthrobacter sp. MYb227]|uniref:tyrosine-type recombinase/integrase n=1 Tax=Arthrobacter sp. MYb227 TaxID=1848601 RepID=UPI0035BE85A5